ncbi:MAG: hypothetical protein ACKE51_02965 [Methylococcaceae bacterium]
MTNEEREVCAELFLAFTNDISMPSHRWNDKAAVELYRMIYALKRCSKGMVWLTSLPVLTSTKTPSLARTALKYLYDVWREKKKVEGATSASGINPRCKDSHTKRHINLIIAAAMGF